MDSGPRPRDSYAEFLWYDLCAMGAALNFTKTTATPILDSGVLPKGAGRKKKISRQLFGFVLGLLFAGVLIASESEQHARSSAGNYLLAFYLLSFVPAIAVHEAGHLVAGWAVGFRFSFVAIGPFSLRLQYGRLKISMRRGMPAGGHAGMQVDRVRRLRHRLLVFMIGGPFANLLTAGLLVLVDHWTAESNWFSLPIRIFWMISLILGLANLVPIRAGMRYTDGARVKMLLTALPRSRRWISITALANQRDNGVRPRQLRQTWLRAAGVGEDGSVDDFSGNWLEYTSANDRKDATIAALRLERCLALTSQLGPSVQDIVFLEGAVFTAWFRNDSALAQLWFGKVKKVKAIPKLLRMRADIAMLCARRKFDLALIRWEEANQYIEKLPDSVAQQSLREGFLEWKEEILERRGATTMAAPLAGSS